MGTDEEVIEDEFDENDPFGLNKPQGPGKRKGQTKDGRESVDPFVVGFGELDEDREDEENSGLRPGTFYRPFN
jgi:hypothetical protein